MIIGCCFSFIHSTYYSENDVNELVTDNLYEMILLFPT